MSELIFIPRNLDTSIAQFSFGLYILENSEFHKDMIIEGFESVLSVLGLLIVFSQALTIVMFRKYISKKIVFFMYVIVLSLFCKNYTFNFKKYDFPVDYLIVITS